MIHTLTEKKQCVCACKGNKKEERDVQINESEKIIMTRYRNFSKNSAL